MSCSQSDEYDSNQYNLDFFSQFYWNTCLVLRKVPSQSCIPLASALTSLATERAEPGCYSFAPDLLSEAPRGPTMTSSSGTELAGRGSSRSWWKRLRKVLLASRDILLLLPGVEGLVPDWSHGLDWKSGHKSINLPLFDQNNYSHRYLYVCQKLVLIVDSQLQSNNISTLLALIIHADKRTTLQNCKVPLLLCPYKNDGYISVLS